MNASAAVMVDWETGTLSAAADPRNAALGLAW
jgi:hypothetical protein